MTPRWDYSTPGSNGYNIPNIVYNDPSSRPLRVLTVGAGYSGILMAYQIQKQCTNVEHVVYEKNADVGGTWFENSYPGCGCDIPSHAYTYNFAPNPDWPRYYSHASDIHAYLSKVVDTFDLRQYMTFNTTVIGAYFQEDLGKWKIRLQRYYAKSDNVREYDEECDILVYSTGVLNKWTWPSIEGLYSFKGRMIHSARWPEEYQESEWRNDRVAVVGGGSSSIQIVSAMQPEVTHMDIFVRTGIWFTAPLGSSDPDVQLKEYSEEERETFRRDPEKLIAHGKELDTAVNQLWPLFYSGSDAQQSAQKHLYERTKTILKDERLLEGFAPTFELGCRRMSPGDAYIGAIQKSNVDVHFTSVKSITEHGLVGDDGVEREVDTIICATGFDTTYQPRFPIVGRNGVELGKKWESAPETYLSVAVPDMPNFFIMFGPTWPVSTGSPVAGYLANSEYLVQVIKKMQRDHIKSLVPKQDITDRFNEHVQEWYKHSVFKADVRSWTKDSTTGRINAFWPGSALHYMDVLGHPRYEDFEIEYLRKNPWASLGLGMSVRQMQGADLSPYFGKEYVDPRWLEAIGGSKGDEGHEVE